MILLSIVPKNPLSASGFIKYRDDPRNAFDKKGGVLSSPSKNVRLTLGGEAVTRPGYEDTRFNLGEADKDPKGHYMVEYDLTFFAVGTKVYYVSGKFDVNSTKIDTGITITDGETENTRFEETLGQVLVGNKTDGWTVFMVSRLNGAVSSGASSITGDIDGVARTAGFVTELSISNFNVRIEGTNEEANGTNVGAGTYTLTGTASKAYSDNAIFIIVFDTTGRYPKCEKIVQANQKGGCLYFIGVDADDRVFSSDVVRHGVGFTEFYGNATVEKMLDVTGGASGVELMGEGGDMTNIVATREFIYLFKQNRVGYIIVADIDTSSGARPINVFDRVDHGCLNSDCAVAMGSDTIPFLTSNKRIVAIRVTTEEGAVKIFPDETFDQDIRKTLEAMDENQPDAIMFYHTGRRLLYVQVSIASVLTTLVYDNNIFAWLPPDDNKAFSNYFERKGTLYSTDLGDDTIYEMDIGNIDDDVDIDCQMATGVFDLGVSTEWKEIELGGDLTQDTVISFEGTVDKSTPKEKFINASDFAFTGGRSFSDIAIGQMIIGNGLTAEQLASYEPKTFAIAPTTFGRRFQPVLRSAGAFTWRSYTISATPLSHSISPTV